MDSAPSSIRREDSRPKIRHHYSPGRAQFRVRWVHFRTEGGRYNAFSIFIYVPIPALKFNGCFFIVITLVEY